MTKPRYPSGCSARSQEHGAASSPWAPSPADNAWIVNFNNGNSNDNDRNNGRLDAYAATARSVNTWYVQLEEKYGVLPVADMAGRLGITSLPRKGKRAITARDASLTLGTYEVSPVEMASVYATFASGGIACRPIAIMSKLPSSSA